jgi:hypothetical protein
METSSLTWLAADYHFPATYSCRVPMSSQTCALVSPSPGPATVRLALIRTSIEVFGLPYVKRVLFPHIRAMSVQIRPPERVAISPQVLRAYKVEGTTETLIEAPVSREMAHAEGPMTIYLEVPLSLREPFSQVLSMIGYWGQASGLAWCQSIQIQAPRPEQCVRSLRLFPEQVPARPFFSCILSEFRDPEVPWEEVMPMIGAGHKNPLRLDVYVWPLALSQEQGSGKLYVRTSFAD